MMISPILSYSYAGNIKNNKIKFRGQLEDEFFNAAKSGNIPKQIDCLSNISFDVKETDIETGDNFLHTVFKSNSRQLINKALILFGQKTNNDKDLAESIINKTNYDGKIPSDYTTDLNVIERLSKLSGTDILTQQNITKTVPQTSPNTEDSQQKIQEPSLDKNKKLNELPEGTVITIPDDDDEEESVNSAQIKKTESETNKEADILNENLNEIAGLTKAKKVLLDRIVTPLNNEKNVKDNGFLIYSETKCGKSFLLRSLANTLDRKIISINNLDQLAEDALDKSNDSKKQQDAISKILNENIIQVDNVQDLETAIDFAKENYRKTKKQTVIYIDEIKGILPKVGAAASNSVTKAEQLIEDSASKGFVLVATTRGIDEISPDSIRSGRFDRKIELKLPNFNERKELVDKYLKITPDKKSTEMLLNKMAGFSYKDIENVIDILNESGENNYSSIDEKLKIYAKENDLGELSDTGTTKNYDSTEFKREKVTITFKDVAGMQEVKDKFKTNLIDRLKPESVAWFKEHNRAPISSGFLLYGPPGTGKTYIAEAVAGEAKIPMFKIDSSMIKDKYVGESEKKVRKLFKQLETKFEETGEYSILFIDEANSLLAKRKKELTSDSLSSNNGDSELVNLFLQYLNKAPQKGIIPIIATNYKDEIDDAVLDRLQTQIEVQLPDDDLRTDMVKKEFAKLPKYTSNITEDEIKKIVVRLGGLSSRTISGIIQKALDGCSTHKDRGLTIDDFMNTVNVYAQEHDLPKIDEINKTSGYDGKWKRQNKKFPANFDDVAGMDDVKEIFKTSLIDRLTPEALERFKNDGNRNPIQSNFLLYGPSGTGKTFIVEALAGEMKIPFYQLSSDVIKSGLYGESEKNVKSIFDQLEKKFKRTGEYSILFVDEANDLFGSVKTPGMGGNTSLTNLFLQKTNNSAERGIIVIAATNYKDQIEDAILSRLGKQIYIPLPDKKQRKALIETELKRSNCTKNITDEDINRLVEKLSGFSSRNISGTIKEVINAHLTYSNEQISIDKFEKAINNPSQDDETQSSTSVDNLISQAKKLSDEDLNKFMESLLKIKEEKMSSNNEGQ